MPEPDVDYTYPDINNLFLAYKGWSIRDNGTAAPVAIRTRFYDHPHILSSAVHEECLELRGRTDLMCQRIRTGTNDGGFHPEYSVRSFRPSALHVAGFDSANVPVLRFLDATNPYTQPQSRHSEFQRGVPASSG